MSLKAELGAIIVIVYFARIIYLEMFYGPWEL